MCTLVQKQPPTALQGHPWSQTNAVTIWVLPVDQAQQHVCVCRPQSDHQQPCTDTL